MVFFYFDVYILKVSLINLILKMLEIFVLNVGYEIVLIFLLIRVIWLWLIGWMYKIVNKYYCNVVMLFFLWEKKN